MLSLFCDPLSHNRWVLQFEIPKLRNIYVPISMELWRLPPPVFAYLTELLSHFFCVTAVAIVIDMSAGVPRSRIAALFILVEYYPK